MSTSNTMYPGTQGIEACGDRGDVSLFDEARTAGQVTLVGSPVLKGRVDVTKGKAMLMGMLLFAVAGCTPEVRQVLVKQTQLEVLTVRQELLEDCLHPVPPRQADYLLQNRDGKESLLTTHVVALDAALFKCNQDKAAIRLIQQDQLKRVNEFNAAEAKRVKEITGDAR